jgi:ArsR family transcriptional regulator
MVEFGRELAKKNGFSNLEYQLGDIEKVPLEDESVDLALLSQALASRATSRGCSARGFPYLEARRRVDHY